jgi:hypothetical protein
VTYNEEFAEMLAQARELRLLRAVADAARIFHAKGPDYWDDGEGDPEWSALGAALRALEGEN